MSLSLVSRALFGFGHYYLLRKKFPARSGGDTLNDWPLDSPFTAYFDAVTCLVTLCCCTTNGQRECSKDYNCN